MANIDVATDAFYKDTYFDEKAAYLDRFYDHVDPMDFYNDIFRNGELFQEYGEQHDLKANGMYFFPNTNSKVPKKRMQVRSVYRGLGAIREVVTNPVSDLYVMPAVSFIGNHKTKKNARFMYALAIDFDGCHEDPERKHPTDYYLGNFFSQIKFGLIPLPTYIVNSGTGLHLYYVFEVPVPMYTNLQEELETVKEILLEQIWNPNTSCDPNIQKEPIIQGFRMPGTFTKSGNRTCTAYRTGERTTLSELVTYIQESEYIDSSRLDEFMKAANKVDNHRQGMTREEAMKKYPGWEPGKKETTGLRKKWDIPGKVHGEDPLALYHWWIKQIKQHAVYGHRYFALVCLACYGDKCNVSRRQVKKDAMDLLPFLTAVKPDFPVTEEDVEDAMKIYPTKNSHAYMFRRQTISELSAIEITENKRNGRSRSDHLQAEKFKVTEEDKKTGRTVTKVKINQCRANRLANAGRKPDNELVWNYMREHPEVRNKSKIARDLGISRKTVRKWMNTPEETV